MCPLLLASPPWGASRLGCHGNSAIAESGSPTTPAQAPRWCRVRFPYRVGTGLAWRPRPLWVGEETGGTAEPSWASHPLSAAVAFFSIIRQLIAHWNVINACACVTRIYFEVLRVRRLCRLLQIKPAGRGLSSKPFFVFVILNVLDY